MLSVLLAAMALSVCSVSSGAMPDVDEIKLPGDYRYHLQDVWCDGKALYWAHTSELVKTDLNGAILAKANVSEHHAGLEVRDGKVYVAVCVLQGKTGGKTLPDSRVTVNVYDAETLKLLEEHVTDINDRSGSLTILEDGTFLVGCLRPPDITKTQVRFHHLDRNYKLIKSYVLDNVPVRLGIETIKRHGGCFYLNHYTRDGLCIKLDKDFKEIARYPLNGTCGLVFDGDSVWIGVTTRTPDKKRWRSGLKRVKPPAGFFAPPTASTANGAKGPFCLSWPEGGERPVVLIDFGPDCAGGYPEFVATDVKGAPVVRASYATHPDGLGDKGDFWYETRATYLGPSVDLPILPASVNRYDLFSVTNAGRYASPLAQGLVRHVRLTLDTPGTAVTIGGFELANRGVHATEPKVGSFDCSDAKLAAIWRMSVRTCELSAIPARTKPLHVVSTLKPACDVWLGPSYAYLADGAKRDRLVWSGDLWWAQRNMYAAYGYDSPYMPGSIRMLAENRTPEGYVQACPYPESHGPLKAGDYGPFASDEFAAWFVPVLWDHILHSGDRTLAKELYPDVCDLVHYLRAHCRADGIFEQRRETSKHASALDFGEASTYHRSYMNILNWKVYCDAARLAEWLDDTKRAAEWRAAADGLAAAIRRVFWDAAKGRFKGAVEKDFYWGEANGLALAVKFCTADEAAAIRKTLVKHPHGKFQALYVRGLYEYGYADDAVARIYEHGWDDVLEPSWPGPRLTSECMHLHTKGWGDEAHPDTAIAGILSNYILGVEPTEPGFAKYSIKPHPSKGVTSASGIVPTPWGALQVAWHLDEAGKPVVTTREWRLSPECRLDGNILTVTVPKDRAGGMHAAITKVDLSPYESGGFEATIRVRGEGVTVPPQPYNGVKFMFHYRDKFNGTDQWPGAMLPTGSFGWRTASVGCEKFAGAVDDRAELVLGLQDSSGTVSFDLSTLTIGAPRSHWPVTNLDHVAVYTPDVAAWPRLRGVMSPARDMNEDDFKTLKAWGATLLRYQMMRSWHGVNTNQDLDEFERWLNGKLDNFDKVVLPMAVKYGIKVVLDFHVPPGGRDRSGDMNMFYEEKYANHFIETWRRIARRFRGREGLYGFDLINEPAQRNDTVPGLDYWSLQRRAAEAVRAEDPYTPIIIESNCWDSPTTFAYLSPVKLTNIIYQVHMYAPMDFTHQRVLNTRKWNVAYPNAEKGWNGAFMRDVMKPVRAFQLKHKARIYVGEFSAVAWAPGAENYLRDCIDMFEEYGWDWSYHAYREWAGWSVEHEGEDDKSLRPSPDNPRKRALIEGFGTDAAEWITGSYVVPGEDDYAAHFADAPASVLTRAFTLAAKPVKRAIWRIASPGMYDASVNGTRVNAVALPVWTAFDRRVLEDEYDVTALVKGGGNTLTLELGNGWWNPLPMKMWGVYNLRKTLPHGTPTAKATLEVTYADGAAERIVTDETWQAAEGPVLRNNLYLGEKRDLRRDGGRDKARPSQSARIAKDPPKGKVLPRGEMPPVVVYDRWKAKGVKALPDVVGAQGNARPIKRWIVDMGVNFAGTIRATLKGTHDGDVVTFRYGELQYPDGTVNVMTGVCGQQKRSAANPPGLAEQKDTVICPAADRFVYEPRFTFHGFRYVEVAGLRAAPAPEDFEALAWSADVKDAASFECSDEKINRLREVCRRTFRSNLQGVQSDCPARERFGYGGDLAVTAESFILNYDMAAFYRKVVRDRCDMEALHGVFTSTSPAVFPENGLKGLGKDYRLGWGVDVPIVVDLLLRYYGDRETMREAYPALRRFLLHCAEAFDVNHVPPCIGDHEALEKADVVTTAQCHYHQFLKLTAKFARMLGEAADAERFEATAKELEAVFAAAARYVPAKGFVGNGRQGEECFAIYHRMLPPDDCDAAYGILRENVIGHEYALSTGIFSTQYLLEILLARGDAEIAGKVLAHKGFPGWFYMIDSGATTLWETWAPSDNTYSQNHPMFGSCAAWLMRGILGIQVAEDAVGCDKVRIEPHAVAGITWAKGHLDTPKGRISVSWRLENGRMKVEKSLPSGVTE